MERGQHEKPRIPEEQRIKASLRETILARRDTVDSETRNAWSRDIIREIAGLRSYRDSGVILAYSGFGSELQTDDFLRRTLELGKTLFLPRVNRETRSLDIYEVNDPEHDLEPGTWGILEPDLERCEPADFRSVDFVLVPGVAFDARGGRLGHGAGFYDKLLSLSLPAARPWLVAGAFGLQVVESVPVQVHDVPMDLIVTESGRYPQGSPARRDRL